MRGQLRSMGSMFDWRREAISADPEYYRWTEWFFVRLFKQGLAYRKNSAVDWCPNCNTTLAREQVQGDDRHCERCDTPVIKKVLDQWFFRTTSYADELIDFSKVDWPDRIKASETNWVGRSEGAAVTFKTEAGDPLEVFTTRPDTLWGVTFMVLPAELPMASSQAEHEPRWMLCTAAPARPISAESADKKRRCLHGRFAVIRQWGQTRFGTAVM